MSRWIDADALNDVMYHEAFENDESYNEKNPMAKWDSGLWIRYKMFENAIADAPSIDIVRCKECKNYIDFIGEQFINAPTLCGRLSTLDNYVVVKADDFCSYGERRE